MVYLQFFADYAPFLEPFDDAERGRLLTGMLAYAFDGTEPEFAGNERFIWPVFRKMIDQSRASMEKKQAASARGLASRWNKEEEASNVIPCQAVAENATAYQCIADNSSECQSIANDATACQPIANDGNNQESINKNQDTRINKQTPKDKKQGTRTKTQEIHTQVSPTTTRESRTREGPDRPMGGRKPWYDPEHPEADCDDGWKTSDKARAAIAQRIIDYVGKGFVGKPYHDLHGLVCRMMQHGIHPDEIQAEALGAGGWMAFQQNLALSAFRQCRHALAKEDMMRFIPVEMLRAAGILAPSPEEESG